MSAEFRKYAIFLFLAIWFAPYLNGQTSSAVLIPKDSIGIGEKLKATVRIKKPSYLKLKGIDISSLFNPENPVNPFASQDSTKVNDPADLDITSLGKWEEYFDNTFIPDDLINWTPDDTKQYLVAENDIEMIFWDPGVYLLDGVSFIPLDSNNQVNTLQLQPTILKVIPPAVFMDTTQTQLELRPIKNVLYEEKNWRDYTLWFAILALLIIGLLGFYFRKRFIKDKEILEEEEEVYIPPHIIAIEKLEQLRAQELWQKGKIKEYQTQLTHIIREYLENRYEVPALEMTTDEITYALRRKSFDANYEEKLRTILTMADLIKFAKAQPAENIHSQFMDTAMQFVQETQLVIPEIDEEE